MLDNIAILTTAPVFNVQLMLDGIFIGAIFALAAYGLALVWGVMNVKNLAQGELVIMGGYIAHVMAGWGIHPIMALVPATVVMFLFGWVLYRLIIRWIIRHDMFTSLLATFGLALVIQQSLNLAFGPEIQTVNSGFEIRFILDGMVTVADIKFVSFLLWVLLAGIVVLFMKR
ncbi:MAG: branched-chain amino acid ABC transporter permease, partial [Gammaproteobacteria bacterium]|nr:branched-chain amino acid ABC transporter permease [Gammaproteobacteria bacterium]